MADQAPPKTGRSRGRAKGRARPAQAEGRPGEEPRPVVGPTGAAPGAPPVGSGGRQTHRGVPRTDPRPGERPAGGDISQRMEGLSIQPHMVEGAAAAPPAIGRAGRTYRMEEEVRTRPSDLPTKQATNAGEEIEIATNYFQLQSRPRWCVYQYHVDFAPLVESPRIRRALLGDHRDVLGECYLFDGMSDLKMITKLEHEVTELCSVRKTDNENIFIKIKRTNELAPDNPQLQHLFNTQMRRNLQHLNYKLIGRNYFDAQNVTHNSAHKLQIWQGIVTSVRMQERQLLMSVDTIHKIVRQETVWDKLSSLASVYTRNNEFRTEATKELVGAVVMTRYNNRTYSIEDICWDEKPSDTFESKAGEITYLDYYKAQYGLAIRDQRQPLLNCASKEREIRGGQRQAKRIMLVPEMCLLTGLTDQMRSNFGIMKDIAKETRLEPRQRVNNLQAFIAKVNEHPQIIKEMKSWDLAFSRELVTVKGHILPPEDIKQQECRSTYDPKTADFSQAMRAKKMHVPVVLSRWLCICTKRDQHVCMEFLEALKRVCGPMGMNVQYPEVVVIDDDRIGTFHRAFHDNKKENTQLVLFVVPNNRKERYDSLKKLCCVDHPIPNQVVVARTLNKKQSLMSVSTKIGIQLNCKLGGEPWALNIPLTVPVMIVGYDTYHHSTMAGRSAGGFVASMNPTFTRWYSQVNFHKSGLSQELSDHMYSNLFAALRRFKEINGTVPKMIIFYRDGVGDGQIRYVLEWEVKKYLQCLQKVIDVGLYDPDKNKDGIKCAFIVVNKRIATRFFAKQRGSYCNPPPGTTVDDVVTRYERYDFFLVSQSVRQGTVAPTMYNIIQDCSGFRPVHMQRLSYKLTHLYFNWPGTVRVPAPCQYAHKLAFLAGQSLHRKPAESLADTLFYL